MNKETESAINAAMQSVRDAMLEESARTGAIRYLVEQLFANAFICDPNGFDEMLSAMIERTRKAPVIRGEIDQETLLRLQEGTAKQLENFRVAVLNQLKKAPREPSAPDLKDL